MDTWGKFALGVRLALAIFAATGLVSVRARASLPEARVTKISLPRAHRRSDGVLASLSPAAQREGQVQRDWIDPSLVATAPPGLLNDGPPSDGPPSVTPQTPPPPPPHHHHGGGGGDGGGGGTTGGGGGTQHSAPEPATLLTGLLGAGLLGLYSWRRSRKQ
jgi:hypothetical protein